MEKETQFREVTLRGFYNENTNVFRVMSVADDEEYRRPVRHTVRRSFFGEVKEKIGYIAKRAVQNVQMKIYNHARIDERIHYFCDDEGRIYFLDENNVRYFISEDEEYALSEDGYYYKISDTDEGRFVEEIPDFDYPFPFKFVSEPKEEFDFDLNEFVGFEELEEADPFAPKKEKERKVIDLDVERFLRDREGRGR